jgi:hypothetical protein
MQEADLGVDQDVAGEEHFFAAGTDMNRDVARRVTAVSKAVTPVAASAPALIWRSRGWPISDSFG